jgi:sugar phosphate isomerase/epimerase
MNLSIVLSAQPTSFSAIPFTEGLAENIVKIKDLGYDGVELAVRNPDQIDLEWLKPFLKENNLVVPAIGTGQILSEEGLSYLNPDAEIRRKAIERIKLHVHLAKELNAHVIIGLVRGQIQEEISAELQEEWLIEAFTACASTDKSVKMVIEPINRYETNVINTIESGLNFIEKVGMDNIGLLLDTFHMNIEEPSITASILLARERCFHFHVADSNRWYPGAGHINFQEIADTLTDINYEGFITAEMLPLPDPDTSAIKTIEYMRKLT